MNEIINFDALTSYFKKHAKKGTKLQKIARTASFLWTLFAIIATVWSLIPKEEKLTGVDAETLIDETSAKNSDMPEITVEQTEPVFEKEI